ncbi:hypothetical protein RM530_11890 [Algiphilus sp. W345]|uniref:Uncharacterized protein n=1 Tax=Banduia mediterranea TaxID=3075609 RepID=A0ABU2WKB9_9GAMM|nr:hypothetical protein [Algiphilus sp. W345]MDT0498059.1 hypothetical protein [Algiphilus sp. W345]
MPSTDDDGGGDLRRHAQHGSWRCSGHCKADDHHLIRQYFTGKLIMPVVLPAVQQRRNCNARCQPVADAFDEAEETLFGD